LAIHVALNHITRYRYDRQVALGPQVVRLRPAPHCRTPILSYSLRIAPVTHFINWQQDPFGNYLARLVFPDKTTSFEVSVDLVAEMAVYNPFDFFLEPEAETFPFRYSAEALAELAPYLVKHEATPRFAALLASIDLKPQRTIDFLVGLNQRLQRDIRYLIRMEPGVQTPEVTLVNASGSCRDSGWLMVQLLRHLGLAARFVSGYLIQLKADVKSLDGPSGTETDFTDLHAWCEVYLPGAGWIGFDPTSGLMAGEGHIPVACTPEPGSAAPVSGAVDDSEVTFEHHMAVTRIHESPRVTQPYSDDQWRAITALGDAVDKQLVAGDVRLTMGGEPTFVSIDDREGAEWNTDALGPTKRGLAQGLTLKLRERYGAGGFLHFGQGKWYPGEQLPRWALTVAWRADGQKCWSDAALFADERTPHKLTSDDAERFMHILTAKLGVNASHAQPAFEDVYYYLWRERKLPLNVDPFDSQLDDEMERARLKRVFDQGLKQVVGFVLPLGRAESPAGPRWLSGEWKVRGDRLHLLPGDSPMGWRLPLDSLPWVKESDYPYVFEQDPFAPRSQLKTHAQLLMQPAQSLTATLARAAAEGAGLPLPRAEESSGEAERASTKPKRFVSDASVIRTALCIEVRDPKRANGPEAELATKDKRGLLYVFMPPLVELEDYLALLTALEATAAELKMPIVLEGYPPPRDPRLKTLAVTPDPGVIEVNIHPAHNWRELVDHTEFLYEAAHQTRLAAEKFMVDGHHGGTGGGNHFVLGGATPADSPFLRRPDLLASLLTYWHNHPSLSYLFSGQFIGPTSQHPRFDEARNDQVYEVEIALKEIERQLGLHLTVAPWLIDRTLRHLLIDVTGNTHRAEFCIDKLYSPDSATGRLGLLELRAFEMPPHARMSLAQQLLMRALVAWFWRTPYRGGGDTRLTRWGTAVHDRFLLPTFVRMDFDDVIADLQRAGFAFHREWFAPHAEFRFPRIGEVRVQGIEVALRSALEPWNVMGEENTAGGTARYVDASLERLEVKATGLNGNRHAVTVNGRPLPLQPTGRMGEFVCGVRYRAWQPPSALHPTIGVHAPLTFDVVDRWSERSLGGCRYHVEHPGGRNEATLPVNAYEAESRRLARFESLGHTPGRMVVGSATPSREFPFTLDLRLG
jgi:uncharacterized protein (DUF2126 family)/transglutaminase-like putative cysteine protease